MGEGFSSSVRVVVPVLPLEAPLLPVIGSVAAVIGTVLGIAGFLA